MVSASLSCLAIGYIWLSNVWMAHGQLTKSQNTSSLKSYVCGVYCLECLCSCLITTNISIPVYTCHRPQAPIHWKESNSGNVKRNWAAIYLPLWPAGEVITVDKHKHTVIQHSLEINCERGVRPPRCSQYTCMYMPWVGAYVHCMYTHLFHVTMEISVYSVENIPRYTADTVGACDNLVYYLVMHTHMKPDSAVRHTVRATWNKIVTFWSLQCIGPLRANVKWPGCNYNVHLICGIRTLAGWALLQHEHGQENNRSLPMHGAYIYARQQFVLKN